MKKSRDEATQREVHPRNSGNLNIRGLAKRQEGEQKMKQLREKHEGEQR